MSLKSHEKLNRTRSNIWFPKKMFGFKCSALSPVVHVNSNVVEKELRERLLTESKNCFRARQLTITTQFSNRINMIIVSTVRKSWKEKMIFFGPSGLCDEIF